MRIRPAVSLALIFVACKEPAPPPPPPPPTPSGKAAYLPSRLEWTAVQAQGVFGSALAAYGKREYVVVEAQQPNTLVIHLIPIDAVVNMQALQQDAEALKGMWVPEADGWKPVVEVRIEPAGSARR